MIRSEIEEIVKNFLIEDFEVEEEKIVPEALLIDDIGIDSLEVVDLIVLVNRNFGFRIKPEELKEVKTLAQFYDYIEAHTTL